MPVATLQALEEQLSLALAAAQRHLEASAAHTASTTSPRDDTEQLHAISIKIERLHTELQTTTAAILAKTNLHTVSALTSPVGTSQASTQVEPVADSETETEDEDLGFESQDLAQKRPRDAAGDGNELPDKKKRKQEPPTKEQMKANLLRFVHATEKTCSSLQAGATKLKTLSSTFGLCRSVSNNILLLLNSGEIIDDETANLYRDTTGKLAAIVTDKRAVGQIPTKSLDMVILRLGNVLELADKATGIPAALSDPTLRSTRLKLKKYADDHWDDMLLSLLEYVQSVNHPGPNVLPKLQKLLNNFGKELTSFVNNQDLGMGPRSEERWKFFDEVAMTLARWIGLWPKASKQPKEISSVFRTMRRFHARFPDRIPQKLFRIARDRNYVCLAQRKEEKKARLKIMPQQLAK